MIKKILICTILIISILPSQLNASNETSDVAKKWFTNFSKNIDKKYNHDKKIIYFKWFNDKLNYLLWVKKFNEPQKKLINDLIKLSNEYSFKEIKKEKEKSSKIILKTNSLINTFNTFSYNEDHIFLENWIWYTYKFDWHLTFPKWVEVKKSDLSFNKITPSKSLVFLKEDNTLWFVNDYKKIKLISDSIIYWIPWKYNFLKEIKDDKKKIVQETDKVFQSLKEKTIELTKWKTKEEKIKTIYNYILSNVKYTDNFTLQDWRIFSWVETYTNKDWVCEWYVKMFLYMLNFANINNSEVIRWYVIDAQDFPKVWHAWLRIWNRYYDPTFDDPIWQTETKKYTDYKYYNLPKDLFYTNRYDFDKIPEVLKTKNLEFRKEIIVKNTLPLISKYKKSWYNILKPYIWKEKHWIKLDKKLDINDLKKITHYHTVENFKFTRNWTKVSIKSLQYYKITDSWVDDLMEQINYNLNWYYLFKWKLENWDYEYRVGYNVKF